MYESFYGLKEKPFTLLPDPEYLYMSPKHQRALSLLEYGMMNQAGFSVICGDTGAGKTTLIRRLLTELGDDTTVGLITNTHQSFGDLLDWVLMAFGLDSEGLSKSKKHQAFVDFLIDQYSKNKRTVLIVDEAQNIQADMLEELRMLSNINADKDQVLQVILAGQPALRDTLRKPELMQFAQRIAVDYYLESLSGEETAFYIHHRLKVAGADKRIFTDEACDSIYRYSGGTPRLINLLCDTTLVYGFAEQTEIINKKLVDDVVREQHGNSIVPTFNNPLTDEEVSKQDKVTSELIEEELIAEELENKIAKTTNKVTEEKVQEDVVIAEPSVRASEMDSSFDAIANEDLAEVGSDSEHQEKDVEPSVPSEQQSNLGASDKPGDQNTPPISQTAEIKEDSEEKTMDEVYASIEMQAAQKAGLKTEESEQRKESNSEIAKRLAEEELDSEELVKDKDHDAVDINDLEKDFHDDEAIISVDEKSTEKESDSEELIKGNVQEVDEVVTAAEEEKITQKEKVGKATEKRKEEVHAEDKGELQFEHIEEEGQQAFQEKKKEKKSIEDVYPIIQVEDNSKKNINVLVLGFAGGMLLAAILILVMAYAMFGDKTSEVPVQVQLPQNPIVAPYDDATMQAELQRKESQRLEAQRKQEMETVKLQAIEKERDAAMAITKALERERDAALLAAKAQREMRDAEKRASEIIAEQEIKALREVKKAQQRAKKAEIAAAKAKERENFAKTQAKKARLASEKKEVVRAQKEVIKAQVKSEVIQVEPEVTKKFEKIEKSKKSAKFSANPCSSPSAKFLSTCKK